jgi:hypothetical protein
MWQNFSNRAGIPSSRFWKSLERSRSIVGGTRLETMRRGVSVAVLPATPFSPPSSYAAAASAPDAGIDVGEQPLSGRRMRLCRSRIFRSRVNACDRYFPVSCRTPAPLSRCLAQFRHVAADFSAVWGAPDNRRGGCIYAGLGYSDGAVIQTYAGSFLYKSHGGNLNSMIHDIFGSGYASRAVAILCLRAGLSLYTCVRTA